MPIDKENLKRLKDVVSKQKQINLLITQIDPDAVGAAFGMAAIFDCLEKKYNIYYCGSFAHPQNRAIANKFDLKSQMIPVNGDTKEIKNVALVDSSVVEDGRLPPKIEIEPPIIIVDHHRGSDVEEHEDCFFLIENIGAASTLVTELLIALNDDETLSLEEVLKSGDGSLPILLSLGIYTDTNALINATNRDTNAYGVTAPYVNPLDLKQLTDYTLPNSHFANMGKVFRTFKQLDSRIVANVGRINSSDSDDLATIADYFLRKDGVSLVVVWGLMGSKIRLSARNSDLSVPLDEFLKDRFGSSSGAKLTPDGKGEGGALIDLGPWVGKQNEEEVLAMVDKRVQEWIFEKDELKSLDS